jgi:hypothetical protein
MTGYRREIDGLRALAVVPVILFMRAGTHSVVVLSASMSSS